MVRHRAALAPFVAMLVAWMAAACTSPRTEIVLRVGTDMDQGPGHTLQSVTVQLTTADNVRRPLQTFQLLGTATQPLLPADLGITPASGDTSRAVTVDVTALGANQTVLFTYHVIAPFAHGQTTRLDVFLASRCLDPNARAMCSATQTCSVGGCDDVTRTSLPAFAPDAAFDVNVPEHPGADTGPEATVVADASLDADAHVDPCPGGTLCNGQCSVLGSDVHHCGACDMDCTQLPGVDQALVSCVAGACQIVCQSRYGDCNAMPGCETDLHTPLNCGACGSACGSGMICDMAIPTWRCANDCAAGSTPCQGSCTNMMSDPSNCGACGNACPGMPNGQATCSSGICGITCDPGFHSCGGDCVSDSSTSSCGASCTPCLARSRATPGCTAGACTYTCLSGYQHCSAEAADGCESDSASDPANCGVCGNACPLSAPNCVAGVCTSSCVPGGTCARPNPCTIGMNTCVNGTLTCTAAGFVAAGGICAGGVCDGMGTCNPCVVAQGCSTGNACEYGSQVCASGTPACVHDSFRAPGSACTSASGPGVCDHMGTCNPCVAGSTCSTGNPCTVGTNSCSSGAATCVTSGNASPGTLCGGGSGMCDGSGNCNLCTPAVCSYVNPCYSGTIQCPSGACGQGAPLAVATSCPGGVCDGSGTCNACTSGAGCYLSDCERGQIGCTSGRAVCGHAAFQPAGSSCNGGAGVCDGAGACHACTAGTSCPLSDCETGVVVCTSGQPVCSHSAYQPMGAACSSGTGVCDGAGMCHACAAGMLCTVGPCDQGQIVCGSGQPVCTHTMFQPVGTTCVTSTITGVCDTSGTCNACTVGASCVLSECDQGHVVCGSGQPVCTHTAFQPAGTSCMGGAGVCSGMGACNACVAGASCAVSECDAGQIVCGSGQPVCTHTAFQSPGTSCMGGGGVCDGSGGCNACSAGMSCAVSECDQGRIACSSGQPVCGHTAFQPPGTSCSGGTGVCDGSGACNACSAGMSCAVSECDQGQIACGSGQAVCAHTAFQPPGTSCSGGAGSCDGSGNCALCTAGATCTPSNPCDVGAIQCPGGACMDTGVGVPAGIACPGGTCDGSGNCMP